ncbi:hypothetical protein BD626DRAFT_562613 [Schizophyllum amplum]|uniref:Uncharacterized protein n=1 Tax=Schizophyllum amplum TaxID=97359 RepID=A0A550CVG3_9AGAR|nr:hypothetical protein BD626DRAFT_562613 [Auriculariopsis ampla]
MLPCPLSRSAIYSHCRFDIDPRTIHYPVRIFTKGFTTLLSYWPFSNTDPLQKGAFTIYSNLLRVTSAYTAGDPRMCCTFHVALCARRRTRRAAADSPCDAARVAPSDALACPALTAGTRGAMREWRIRYDMRLPPHVPRLLLAIALVNDERPGLDVCDSERTTPGEHNIWWLT